MCCLAIHRTPMAAIYAIAKNTISLLVLQRMGVQVRDLREGHAALLTLEARNFQHQRSAVNALMLQQVRMQ